MIDGAKVFTSGANQADYVWLACRTDPDAPKHKGISIILVPTDAPGFSWTPIVTVGSNVTTATYYDDVRVPAANLVGAENEGWRMITNQLNHERVGLAALGGRTEQLFEDVLAWARATLGRAPVAAADDRRAVGAARPGPLPRPARGDAAAQLEDGGRGGSRGAVARPTRRRSRCIGTETHVEVYRLLLGVVGAAGYLREGSPGAVLRGQLERAARAAQINTFGGGVNDVQRDIVAAAGLHMARQPR